MLCYFVSDLHGKTDRYNKLFAEIRREKPDTLLLGGDLIPHYFNSKNFLMDFIHPNLKSLKADLHNSYPSIFIILGNDDGKKEESTVLEIEKEDLWSYIHFKKVEFSNNYLFGYSFTPPSPFLLKDWEKYDVSRYVDPGCISPEEGKRTVEISHDDKKYSTIKKDLEILTDGMDVSNSIFLFHGPPYKTNLDRAALDGKMIDNVPLDVHVGSIAIKDFIEEKKPRLTLHGHIHESARITGSWKDKIGRTICLSAAHDGKELAMVKFEISNPENAERFLL